jgi:hypothetical protein
MIRNAAALTGICAMLYVVPTRVRGAVEADLKKCMDNAWAHYNSCLMSTESEFVKRMCDLRFVLDVAFCADGKRE